MKLVLKQSNFSLNVSTVLYKYTEKLVVTDANSKSSFCSCFYPKFNCDEITLFQQKRILNFDILYWEKRHVVATSTSILFIVIGTGRQWYNCSMKWYQKLGIKIHVYHFTKSKCMLQLHGIIICCKWCFPLLFYYFTFSRILESIVIERKLYFNNFLVEVSVFGSAESKKSGFY